MTEPTIFPFPQCNGLITLTEQKGGPDHLLCTVETAYMVGSVRGKEGRRGAGGKSVAGVS